MNETEMKLKILEMTTTNNDIKKESNRIKKNKKRYKYQVCSFPSLYGTPIFTNSIILAHLIKLFKELRGDGVIEIYKK